MGEVAMIAIAASWILGLVMGCILYGEVVGRSAKVAIMRRAQRGR